MSAPSKLVVAGSAYHVNAETLRLLIDQRNELLAALRAALPMLDAWLNGDGTNVDMNEWDAATMLCRAALAKAGAV